MVNASSFLRELLPDGFFDSGIEYMRSMRNENVQKCLAMPLRFTIRDLLWLTLVVAMLPAAWASRYETWMNLATIYGEPLHFSDST